MKGLLLFLIRFYRNNISRAKSGAGCCRFTPTCSEYAMEAIEIHGAFKGSLLAVSRVLRCNPFCKGGFDPVPPKKTVFQKKRRVFKKHR